MAAGEPVGDLVTRRGHTRQRPLEQQLLGPVGRRAAHHGAVGQAGGQHRRGRQHGTEATSHQEVETLPPSVRVPSKSKAATSADRVAPAVSGRSGRRRCSPRPAPGGEALGTGIGVGGGQAVQTEPGLDPHGVLHGRPHCSSVDRRSFLRQVWGRASSSRPQATAASGPPGGYDAVDQAHGQGLGGAYLAPGEDEVERPALADQPGQPDRPPVDQGTPNRRQNTPKAASSAATRRSHQMASSRPPATA